MLFYVIMQFDVITLKTTKGVPNTVQKKISLSNFRSALQKNKTKNFRYFYALMVWLCLG